MKKDRREYYQRHAEEINAKRREYHQRPDVKAKHNAKRREYHQRHAEEINAKRREYRQRPDVKAKRREYFQRPDVKVKQREYFQRPDVKAKRREYMREYMRQHADEINARKRVSKVGNVDNIRAICLEHGFSEEVAEAIAIDGELLDKKLKER